MLSAQSNLNEAENMRFPLVLVVVVERSVCGEPTSLRFDDSRLCTLHIAPMNEMSMFDNKQRVMKPQLVRQIIYFYIIFG